MTTTPPPISAEAPPASDRDEGASRSGPGRIDAALPATRTKRIGLGAAVARVRDGDTIMVGGFGIPGTPFRLLEELAEQGQRGLTIIKNDANEAGMGVDLLLENGQVDRLITSHIGLNRNAVQLMNERRISVEFVPQGILAERIRAGGAGLLGIVTDIGIDTELGRGKPRIATEGRTGMLETALRADFAFVHGACADPLGNLRFEATARNFNPLIAAAAAETIAEVEDLVPMGAIDPDQAHLSGVFVDHIVQLDELTEVYGVKR